MNITNRVVILSAELKDKSFESNRQRTINLAKCLEECNLIFNEAQGKYNGIEETCFVVKVRNNTELETVKDFAFKNFGQESVLETDANGRAYLEFNNGETKMLGQFRQVNPKLIEQLESYTIMNNGVYTADNFTTEVI